MLPSVQRLAETFLSFSRGERSRKAVRIGMGFFVTGVWFGADVTSAGELGKPDPVRPTIEEASAEPTQMLATVTVPEGWNIDVFAAEPEVANVVAIDVDRHGRLFVCESFRQGAGITDNRAHDREWLIDDLASKTVQDRIDYHRRQLGDEAATYTQQDDRVRRVVDTDGDHVADTSTVVADGFNGLEEGTGAGVLAHGSDIYYACIPKLWKFIDADDDGVAEQRVVLSDGYGVKVAFRGHDTHGLIFGPRGRLYFSIGDRGYHITTGDGRTLADPHSGAVFSCEPDGSDLRVVATGLRNPQELAFNDVGDLFTVDNNSDASDKARVVQILEGGDSGWRMNFQYLSDRGVFHREGMWRPLHDEQTVAIVPPIVNLTDGPSGLLHYPGTGFGDELKDRFLICDFRGTPIKSGIRSFKLERRGAFYDMVDDAQPIWQVLATDVAMGPDGALYVSDWVDGWTGVGKGRVYRLTHPEHADTELVREVENLLGGDWSARGPEELVNDLAHVDRRVRSAAQFELARRDEMGRLLDTASDADRPVLARLHALWGADQISRRDEGLRSRLLATVRDLVTDPHADVVAEAASTLGRYGSESDHAALADIIEHHRTPRTVYHAASAVVALGADDMTGRLVRRLEESNNEDPAIRHIALRYLIEKAAVADLESLKNHESVLVRRCVAVASAKRGLPLALAMLDDENPMVVGEVVRVIHDADIDPLSATLTDRLAQSGFDERHDAESKLRAINLHYRRGTDADAAAIAAVAADPAVDDDTRIAAVDALRHWNPSEPIDRLTHAYRPMAERPVSIAADQIRGRLDKLLAASEEVREAIITAAADLGVVEIVPQLVARIGGEGLSPEARAKSLEALAALDADRALEVVRGDLPQTTPIRMAALKVWSEFDTEEAVRTIAAATRSGPVEVRQRAWDLLVERPGTIASQTAREGLNTYVNGDLDPALSLNVVEAADRLLTEEELQPLRDYQAAIESSDPLGKYLVSLQGGDIGRGASAFWDRTDLSCQRCHKVGRAGGEVGPELTLIGKEKDRRYLLEAIAYPNAAIAKGFETAIILDDLGQSFSGIVSEETDELVTLVQNDGTRVQIEQDLIIARKKGQSSMPADLVHKMSPRELRDLVAYLASLDKELRSEDDVE